MEHLNLFDALLAVVIFVIVPIQSAVAFPSFIREIRARGSDARVDAYKRTVATWAFFGVLLVGFWLVTDRSWAALGFRLPTWSQFFMGSAIGLAFLIFLVLQLRAIKASGTGADVMRQQLGDLADFMPVTKRDSFWFRWVSINAGFTEELIFRGYVMWALEPVMGLAMAAVMTVVIFTFAHSYQGLKQVPAIGLASVLTIIIFLVSDSLLVPIVFHVVLDLVQGVYLKAILQSQPTSDEPLVDTSN
ncbi:MAG: CPBP family intramembrane glutamic endopeptidase [Pseudomonadota bacterium]